MAGPGRFAFDLWTDGIGNGLTLNAGKKLARVEAADVLEAIEQQGYFLQMPPPPEALAEAQIAAMVKAEEQLADAQNQEPNE